jgi:hypothetical protein
MIKLRGPNIKNPGNGAFEIWPGLADRFSVVQIVAADPAVPLAGTLALKIHPDAAEAVESLDLSQPDDRYIGLSNLAAMLYLVASGVSPDPEAFTIMLS